MEVSGHLHVLATLPTGKVVPIHTEVEATHSQFGRFKQYTGILLLPGIKMGRDSSVNIATRYGLNGLGIESRWVRDFPHPSRLALGPNQPPTQWVPGLSRGWSGRGTALTTHPIQGRGWRESRAIHLHPSRPLWPVLGWTLPLLLLGIKPQIHQRMAWSL